MVETLHFPLVIACNAFYRYYYQYLFSLFIQLWEQTADTLEYQNCSSTEYRAEFWVLGWKTEIVAALITL